MRFLFLLLIISTPTFSETIAVKYRNGALPLDTFQCENKFSSSVVERICYDETKNYLVVNLKGTNYHYCSVGKSLFQSFLKAESKGSFYNQQIKISSNNGLYDCRNHVVPDY